MAINTLEKNSFLKYFEILKDKFFKIMLLNAIYFTVVSILIFIIMGISSAVTAIFGDVSDVWTLLTFLPLILLGPLTAAEMKLMREYVREEPGFFAQDLKKAFKDNFKQSIVIALFQYVIFWAIFIAFRFYYAGSGENTFYTIGLGVTIFVALATIVASYYFYMMTFTLKLTIREIIKNSFIFTMLCIGKNILLTIIIAFWLAFNGILVYLSIISGNALMYGLTICVFMVLTFGILFYTIAFFTFPSIKQYILDPYYEQHPSETSQSVLDKPNAEDINFGAEPKEEDLPEFVYHNGKMVHRSAFEEEKVFSDERIYKDDDKE